MDPIRPAGAASIELRAALRYTGTQLRLTEKGWLAHRPSPQPFVLKRRKHPQVFKTVDPSPRVPAQLGCEFQPEGAAGCGIEVPLNNFPDVCVELLFRVSDPRRNVYCSCSTHVDGGTAQNQNSGAGPGVQPARPQRITPIQSCAASVRRIRVAQGHAPFAGTCGFWSR